MGNICCCDCIEFCCKSDKSSKRKSQSTQRQRFDTRPDHKDQSVIRKETSPQIHTSYRNEYESDEESVDRSLLIGLGTSRHSIRGGNTSYAELRNKGDENVNRKPSEDKMEVVNKFCE